MAYAPHGRGFSREAVLDEISRSPFEKVKVAVADTDGILRGKYLHKNKFLSAADSGFGFCNVVLGWDSSDVCYDNVKYTGWHTGYPDAPVQIDLSTYRRIPWENDLPFFLGEFVDQKGSALEICPRQTLKRVIEKARLMGFEPSVGMEFEWFNFKETPQSVVDKNFYGMTPLSPGMFGYSILRTSQNQPFFAALMDEMAKFGVPIEGLHTETGPGVLEAAILYSDALEAADRAVLFKTGAKEIGHRFGIMPTFMAKWNAKLPGCSGHVHQSLWDSRNESNLFHDDKKPHKMSSTFRSFLAGQMALLPELLPFFAPTVNSYKRLVDGYWAPTKVTWAEDNRTTAFRVIPGSSKSTRLETRVVGSDVNPYLAIAACLASGLYGIERKLELKDEAIVGSGYDAKNAIRLPKNLGLAAEKLAASKIAREILGESLVEHFAQSRIWEWRQYETAVTDWELQRYFEII